MITMPIWILVLLMVYSIIMIIWNMVELTNKLSRIGKPSFVIRRWLGFRRIIPDEPQYKGIYQKCNNCSQSDSATIAISPMESEITNKCSNCSHWQSTDKPTIYNPTHAANSNTGENDVSTKSESNLFLEVLD